MRARARGGDAVTFDFAPMVDVVLLLLIFFFLTSSLAPRDRAVPLTLPGASTSVQQTTALPVVSVDSSGQVFLNGQPTALRELAGQLKPLLGASDGVVGLRADEKGQYGTVVGVMDEIRKAGGQKLALGTKATP
ncbi:biopolymer transporter ExbD [Deinococcus sp. KSM4-11]|uniref:ExbD/TolR family protein n=1 Tax=Deinococcus sp. KSM4-11 TaxID=2568654 RepID=UPI0010A34084|nr:biopolymer transporter ExbD [Deinococcus sp. KSM4-11]THF86789.1 biopolymer transporter ExbD [Deinococcus sp. KSM4-11]